MTKPLLLMILDGWGINPSPENNAIAIARTPNMDRLCATYPCTSIGTSGMDVGLPEGQMGNSEVGHLNIGAGRIVYQDLTRITKSIQDGDFFHNPVLLNCLNGVKLKKGRLHLSGLLSDGGVHSHNTHLYALLELAKREGIEDVFIHCILDGRDTPPQSGRGYLAQLEEEIRRIGIGKIATVSGRYYAMDRDNRWERVEKAYAAMVYGEGERAASADESIAASYAANLTDEFMLPCVTDPNGTLQDGDGFIFFNFRSDRAREITRAIAVPAFDGFQRRIWPALSGYVCMTTYDETFNLPIAFPQEELTHLLGEEISRAGLQQLRIAETEKYAHITFFFNGGSEVPFEGEERVLIPSPKEVATYDQKPEMSARPVTEELLKRLDERKYGFIVLNFANPDMVGHTGILPAAVQAVETVDECVGRLADKVLSQEGTVIITADHGNAEMMLDHNGVPHTAHTTDKAPVILVSDAYRGTKLRDGILADLAPTILQLLGLPQPKEMTGHSLLEG